jgi:hypothetical protein
MFHTKKDKAKMRNPLKFIRNMRITLLQKVSVRETCSWEARYDCARHDQILPGMYLPRWERY